MPSSSRNSGYSASELSTMQQDAVERVREMQRRARQRVEQSNRMAAGLPPAPQAKPQTAVSVPRPQTLRRESPSLPLQGILDRLNLDGETLLLLLILLLLINDGADHTLILALVYLILG